MPIFASVPKGTQVEQVKINGVTAEWIKPLNIYDSRTVLMYFHGGAYIAGGLRSHRDMVHRLAKGLSARAISVEYGLAPEYSYPKPYEDALAVYQGLLAQGIRGDDIILAGDSAGAHLSLMATRRILDKGLEKPKAILCFSPFGDAANEVECRLRDEDPMIPATVLDEVSKMLVPEGEDPRSAEFSPISLNFSDFPPTYINAGENEILVDDAKILHDMLNRFEVLAKLDLTPHMPHAFVVCSKLIPEARETLVNANEFVLSL